MQKSVLVDLTKCIGCRACQVSCKRWNERPGEKTEFFAKPGGYQNPAWLSAKTYTLIEFDEIKEGRNLKWVFSKRQCMHCIDPACASACPVGAIKKTKDGPVIYDGYMCLGCRYCMIACPWDVPAFEWGKLFPYIKKCTFCIDRHEGGLEPSCVKACPTDALVLGERNEMVAEAKKRISANPGKYINHIYGEKEAGGTSWMYLSAVPFGKLGFNTKVGDKPLPKRTSLAMKAIPGVILGVGALFTGLYFIIKRRDKLQNTVRTGGKK